MAGGGGRGQIGQVIRNMALNAREAMPAGGVISVQAENVVLSSHGKSSPATRRLRRVSVADRAPGISKEVLPKIFDPYFRRSREEIQKGHGPGVAIPIRSFRNMVEPFQWSPSLALEPPSTSTFRIAPKESRNETLSAQRILSRHGRILVMDDEESVRTVLGGKRSG